jgi:ribosome biogenesis protein BRX1
MAAVYKSLSKKESKKSEAPTNGVQKNKQRVLILSSRGVTYRSVSKVSCFCENPHD